MKTFRSKISQTKATILHAQIYVWFIKKIPRYLDQTLLKNVWNRKTFVNWLTHFKVHLNERAFFYECRNPEISRYQTETCMSTMILEQFLCDHHGFPSLWKCQKRWQYKCHNIWLVKIFLLSCTWCHKKQKNRLGITQLTHSCVYSFIALLWASCSFSQLS